MMAGILSQKATIVKASGMATQHHGSQSLRVETGEPGNSQDGWFVSMLRLVALQTAVSRFLDVGGCCSQGLTRRR
jgi:hypothetical protein